MGMVVEVKFVRDLVLCELTERGLMNGWDGASMAETGSPRWRIGRRPYRASSSFVSRERCSRDGGGGDCVERELEVEVELG
jgi:hypothetical protein